jgi:hypothetical protein
MEHRWDDIDRGRPKYSTTNPTWTDPGSNPGLRGGRPAANRLSHGTAYCGCLVGKFVTYYNCTSNFMVLFSEKSRYLCPDSFP